MGEIGVHADVREWGALGTGDPAVDDAPAINEAISHVAAGGGGVVAVPPGHYYLQNAINLGNGSTEIHSSVALVGAGKGATKFTLADGFDTPVVRCNGSASTPLTGVEVSGMTLDGNRAGQTQSPSCLRAQWIERCTFRDLRIMNAAGYGIGLEGGGQDQVTIEDCLIEDSGSDGIDMKSAVSEVISGLRVQRVTVRNFDALNSGGKAGIDLRAPGVTVIDCVVEDFGGDIPAEREAGIRLRHGEYDVTANGDGPHRALIANCQVRASTPTDITADLVLGYNIGARGVQVVNCTAVGCTTGFQTYQENTRFLNCAAIDAKWAGFRCADTTVSFDRPSNGRGAVLTGCSSVVEERLVGVATGGTTGRVDLQANVTGNATGVDTDEITLAGSASSTDDFYAGRVIEITSASTGAGQRRTITAYDGTTKVATVSADWAPALTGTIGYKVWFRSETDDYYNGRYVEMLSGAAAGQMKRVTSYDGATGQATTGAFGTAPSSGDSYQIVANPDGFVIETNDCVVSGCRVIGPAVESTDAQTYGAEFASQTTNTGALVGASAGSANLDAGAAAVNGAYVGQLLGITSGAGAGQTRKIVSYLGSTRAAAITPDWDTTPAATDTYTITSLDGNVWTAGRMTGIWRLADHLNGEADAGQIHEYLSVRPLHALGSATAYTLALTDAGKFLESNRTGGAVAITIPHEDDVLFPTGTLIRLANQGTATVTLTPGTGVTLNTVGSLTNIAQNGVVELYKRSPTTWYATGDLT